jgi:hypothetical protein
MLNGKTTTACRNFLSSLPADAKMLVSAVREHLGIKNSLHWVLNMAYAEDTSHVRKDHAPQNLATLRHFAGNLLRQEKTDKDCVKSAACRQAGITTSCFKFLPMEQMLNAIALTAGARTLAVTMVHFYHKLPRHHHPRSRQAGSKALHPGDAHHGLRCPVLHRHWNDAPRNIE